MTAPVLLAIRNPDMRETLCHLLQEEAGYEVIETHNGLSTLTALLTSSRPLVVVLDSHLDGHNAAERLLRLALTGGPAGRHQYVIYITYTLEELSPSFAACVTLADMPQLVVPFDANDLLRTVTGCQTALAIASAV
jgi:CheY-like chemotaxis protein